MAEIKLTDLENNKKVVKKENINTKGNKVIFQSITKAINLLNLTLI